MLSRCSRCVLLVLLVCCIIFINCGGDSGPTAIPSPNPGGAAAIPQFAHVAIIVLENQNYADVVGSSAMPYLNGLINQYGLATNYFANAHPSLPNYFVMTVGSPVTFDNNFSGVISSDNIVRKLSGIGKSWRGYMQSLPHAGYLGGDVYPYVKHHDPFVYLSDVTGDSQHANNVVPLSQLSADLAGTLPNYIFVVPDQRNNGHDCPSGDSCMLQDKLAASDNFVRRWAGALMGNPQFQQNGLLVITYDEAQQDDLTNGGGKIATVLVGSKVKGGSRSNVFMQHENLLRTVSDALGVAAPGAGATAEPMREFF